MELQFFCLICLQFSSFRNSFQKEILHIFQFFFGFSPIISLHQLTATSSHLDWANNLEKNVSFVPTHWTGFFVFDQDFDFQKPFGFFLCSNTRFRFVLASAAFVIFLFRLSQSVGSNGRRFKKNKPPKINRRKVMKLPVWFGVLSSLFLCSNPAFLGGGSPSPPQWGSTATLNGRGTRNLTLVFQVFVADLAYCFYSSAAELETTPKKKNLVSFFIEKMSTRFGRNCYDLIPLCFSFQTRSS